MNKHAVSQLVLVWIVLVIVSFVWNYHLISNSTTKIVLNKARAFFDQIVVTRSWNAEHGGVYVPVTNTTQPNEYLKDNSRDVVTTDGVKLTKINPAYMTRQIADHNKSNKDLQFHITSLKPIRPQNKADEWETEALKLFEEGFTEKIELIKNEVSSQYRYMAPLITKKNCLKCHAEQGYKINDIRGGISVSFPSAIFTRTKNKQVYSLIIIHFLTLLVGIIGIYLYYRMSTQYYSLLVKKNTELEKKEKQLISNNEYLKLTNAKKDKLFSIIGHDLKNPFSSVVGLSELIMFKKDSLSNDKISQILESINSTSKNAYQLLENLLQWSISEMDKTSFKLELIDLNGILNSCIQLSQVKIQKKEIAIFNDVPSEYLILADANMIDLVIRNLLSNALKYNPVGGEVYFSVEKKEKYHHISIRDTGIGIPDDRLKNLFSLEASKSTPGTMEEPGTGLGLLLCKEFVTKHGGTIQVDSTTGKGSCFTFTIPIR